jgi:UDP-glucose 4-epimerase
VNLGTEEYIEVNRIADIICEELKLKKVKYKYSDGERGWVGDSPFILLDVKKMKSMEWKPSLTIEQSVCKTINWLKENQWVYDERKESK